jgi:hypothetical protein
LYFGIGKYPPHKEIEMRATIVCLLLTSTAAAKSIDLSEPTWWYDSTLGQSRAATTVVLSAGGEDVWISSQDVAADSVSGTVAIEGAQVVYDRVAFAHGEGLPRSDALEVQIPGTFDFSTISATVTGGPLEWSIPGTVRSNLWYRGSDRQYETRLPDQLTTGHISGPEEVSLDWSITAGDVTISDTYTAQINIRHDEPLWANIDILPDSRWMTGTGYSTITWYPVGDDIIWAGEIEGVSAQLRYANARAYTSANGQLTADFNDDGYIDEADGRLILNRLFRPLPFHDPDFSAGDANADGMIDVADFNIWNAHYLAAGAAVVPEPNGSVLVIPIFVLCLWISWRDARLHLRGDDDK